MRLKKIRSTIFHLSFEGGIWGFSRLEMCYCWIRLLDFLCQWPSQCHYVRCGFIDLFGVLFWRGHATSITLATPRLISACCRQRARAQNSDRPEFRCVWWTRSVRGSRSPIFDSVSLQAVKTSVMPFNRSSSGPTVNVCLWCDSWVKIRLNSQVSVLSSALNTLPLHLLIPSVWNQDVCFGLLSMYWNRTIFLSIDQRFCAQVKSYLLLLD